MKVAVTKIIDCYLIYQEDLFIMFLKSLTASVIFYSINDG